MSLADSSLSAGCRKGKGIRCATCQAARYFSMRILADRFLEEADMVLAIALDISPPVVAYGGCSDSDDRKHLSHD